MVEPRCHLVVAAELARDRDGYRDYGPGSAGDRRRVFTNLDGRVSPRPRTGRLPRQQQQDEQQGQHTAHAPEYAR